MDSLKALKNMQSGDELEETNDNIRRITVERADFIGELRDDGKERKCHNRKEF